MDRINMDDQHLLVMHEMSQYPPLLEPSSSTVRRRLPPTPRRSSSPRILPTPPPSSPDCMNHSALFERRPSGRKLPMPPNANDWSLPSPTVHRKFSEMSKNTSIIIPTLISQHHHQSCSFDQSSTTSSASSAAAGTAALAITRDKEEAVGVSLSNIMLSKNSSQSIDEQATSKSSSSDVDDLIAHGIDISLYQTGISTSSKSAPEISPTAATTNANAVPTSSSWTENETHPNGLGLLHFSLQHFPVRKRLRISILKAEGLAGQLKPELEIHAYCKLVLLPGGKTQNSIVRRGRDVVFNQEFFFDGILSDELNDKCLNITVCHQSTQKLQKDPVIGELFLPLKNLSELQTKKEIKVIEELKHHINPKKLGRLSITCCIEKDAQRLTINIIKAEDLPKGGITGPPDVCVRIRLEQKGKSQLKQSRIIKGTCCAVYKEAVMFLISPKLNDLYDTNITITVHDLSRTITGDDLIGSVFLGKIAVDKSEIDQWKNAIEHQGKEYKGTHHLKPSLRTPDVVAEAPSDSE